MPNLDGIIWQNPTVMKSLAPIISDVTKRMEDTIKEYLNKDGTLDKFVNAINHCGDHTEFPSLRLKDSMSEMQERDARGGTRYTEIIRSHFGVASSSLCILLSTKQTLTPPLQLSGRFHSPDTTNPAKHT